MKKTCPPGALSKIGHQSSVSDDNSDRVDREHTLSPPAELQHTHGRRTQRRKTRNSIKTYCRFRIRIGFSPILCIRSPYPLPLIKLKTVRM